MDEKNRPLYMIGVAARLLGVHPQTLRLYEREGLISPFRTEGNTRLYSQKNIEEVKLIMYLTREAGINLAGVELIVTMRRRLTQISTEMGGMIDRVLREMDREMLSITELGERILNENTDKKGEGKVVRVRIEKD